MVTKVKCDIRKPIIPKAHSSEKHVCDTCKEEIPDISRVLVLRDVDGGPRLLCYHYFFPCWNMELLCQKYPHFVIDMMGFSFPENISIKQSSINEMKKELKFWV